MLCLPPPSLQSEHLSHTAAGTLHMFAQSGHCPSQRGHSYCSLWLVSPGLGSAYSKTHHYAVAFRDLRCGMFPTELVTAPLEKILLLSSYVKVTHSLFLCHCCLSSWTMHSEAKPSAFCCQWCLWSLVHLHPTFLVALKKKSLVCMCMDI